MHLQHDTSSGSQAPAALTTTGDKQPAHSGPSSALPFGKHLSLSSMNGPTYVTAQLLVQQAAYLLSDKVFAYSPDSFDLDLALRQWQHSQEQNTSGFVTGVHSLQTRTGAGAISLGYIFSPDFDLKKRHLPQSIVASAATLKHLRSSLDELSLLYSVASPVVLHVAALDYSARGTPGLVTDYVYPQALAEDLGLNLVSSTSTYEAQHMSLFATLLAREAPTIHLYDGLNVGRETTRVVDTMGKDGLDRAYKKLQGLFSDSERKRIDGAGKAVKLLQAFNEELGTDYKPFEYYGHAEAETVLVVFGSVEGSLAAQLAFALSQAGHKVGAVNVRIYRPFVEEAFVDALPKTTKQIRVLGQVDSPAEVADAAERSQLYSDVLAAVSFAPRFAQLPTVVDDKYARSKVWTPAKISAKLQHPREDDILGPSVKQYSFWDLDATRSPSAPTAFAELLASARSHSVSLRGIHNNLARGGTVRVDVRSSEKSIEAPYSIRAASFTYIGSPDLLHEFDVVKSANPGSTIVVRLPGSKDQDLEKLESKLPVEFRKQLGKQSIKLVAFDPEASAKVAEEPSLEDLLAQTMFVFLNQEEVSKAAGATALGRWQEGASAAVAAELENTIRHIEIPESWTSAEDPAERKTLAADLRPDALTGFSHEESTTPGYITNWISAAQSLAFKEAAGHQNALRPELTAKTFEVRVKSRQRLTPTSYDRNIFHIEFDLGSSGLTYNIGEALGIHAENDSKQVLDFIRWYSLDPDDLVSVPARTDPSGNVREVRTVYQALMQNIDMFGRPPKRFYAELAEYATVESEKKSLLALGGTHAAIEFKRRAEVDTITFADVLAEFPSAHPSLAELALLVDPLKRREYSIASSQHVQTNSVSLLIVTVNWVDPRGRDRFGQATRYLNSLAVGDPVTVSVKPSVMKLPKESTAPLIMAGLGTGLAPFRAFVQERAYQRDVLHQPIGEILLYMGSRHQREEYLYGEEWEAYLAAEVLSRIGCAFSRDQPHKIYIQDRMRDDLDRIRSAYLAAGGAFYLCGPTWPVPDVQAVLEEAIGAEARATLDDKAARRVNPRRRIEELKDEGRYVLEVY